MNVTPHNAAKFIVLPESRSHHGTSWGPFTLGDARQFVRQRGGGFIVLPGDENDPNPRIWNYVNPDEVAT